MRTKTVYLALITTFMIIFTANLGISADSSSQFQVFDVSIEEFEGIWTVQGQLKNNSGKSYELANFKLSIFGSGNKLLGSIDFSVQNLERGETITFEEYSIRELSGWRTFKIRLDGGF